MNDVQAFIDRQLGLYTYTSYDSVLHRLMVQPEHSFYGLQNNNIGTVLEHDPPIFACRFSEAPGYENVMALANEDGGVVLQDISKIQPNTTLESFQCHNNAVFDLAWRPQHMSFVTVSGDHTASLWDVGGAGPSRLLVYSSHTRSVKTAAFGQDGALLATGGRDGHVFAWDGRAPPTPALVLKAERCLADCHALPARRPDPRATSITGLVFQDDHTLISCGECDGNIKVWDLRKNYSIARRRPLPKHSIPYCGSSTMNGYTNLVLDPTGVRLYASCMDHVIYCFNVATYGALPERRYVGHQSATFYIKTSLSRDGRYLVSGSSDKCAYVWNVRQSQPVVRLEGHHAEVTCATWAPRGPALVTCSDDARHKVWAVGPHLLDDDQRRLLQGRAAPAPPSPRPRWATPAPPPRANTPLSAPAPRRPPRAARRSKRSLTDMLNAARPDDDGRGDAKRPRCDVTPPREPLRPLVEQPEARSPPVTPPRAAPPGATPPKRPRLDADWSYISPQPGSSFMTPTKLLERGCRRLPPLSPRSPARRWSPPTAGLPDYALRGEAPHLRLMSPAKARPPRADWLTLLSRARQPPPPPPRPPPPRSPPRPASPAAPRTPKSHKRTKTLLKYFTVKNKDQ